ncbi:gluconate 2-dehydrogenase subunit 3 family protein [Bradyrhizobium sp.]|uniref:gluconate 2-dehydrogenase subunit 3 family protein n=1 Tax=Bradyrhizobium sp. TaxID=376 RepID=UPI0025C238EC|nr:gluconate 2-dehydrogenase subunit 3 family protein [Bradyrhizobium sp.]
MKRRHLLALLGTFSFGGAAAPWRLVATPLRAPGTREHVTRSMAAVAETMFPGDGLPGAAALGVHQQVLAVPDLQARIAQGMAWLDRHAASLGAADFLALDQAGRLAALDAAFASRDDGIQLFVLTMRDHLGTAYYSTPAIKSAFAYTGPPQPDGFADFQQRPS